MSTLKSRIEQVLRETQLGITELARLGKVSSSAASQWTMEGGTRELKANTAHNLARGLAAKGFTYAAEWLATGAITAQSHGVIHLSTRVNEPRTTYGSTTSRTLTVTGTQLPVLPWERIQQMAVPNDHAELQDLELRAVPVTAGPSAKLVEVNDPAMAGRLNPGDVLQFDPAVQPRPGAIVLVRTSSGEHLVRTYRQRTAASWIAAPANPDYAILDSEADGLQLVAVATHRIERLL